MEVKMLLEVKVENEMVLAAEIGHEMMLVAELGSKDATDNWNGKKNRTAGTCEQADEFQAAMVKGLEVVQNAG